MVMSLYLYQTVDLNEKALQEILEEYFSMIRSVQQEYVTTINILCTQHGNAHIYKAANNKHKGSNQ